jgi:hypothetical protein
MMEAREDTSLDEFVSSNIKTSFTVQIECEQCRSSPSVEKLTSAKNYQKLIAHSNSSSMRVRQV